MPLKHLEKETSKIVKIGVFSIVGCGLYYCYHHYWRDHDNSINKVLQCYQNMIKMGFEDKPSFDASKRFKGDINAAMTHITSNNHYQNDEKNNQNNECIDLSQNNQENDEKSNECNEVKNMDVTTLLLTLKMLRGYEHLLKMEFDDIDNTNLSNDNDENEHSQCDKCSDKCQHIKRLLFALKYYEQQQNASVIEYLLIFDNYDGIAMMKDLIHYKNYHTQHSTNLSECNNKECFVVKRHRSRHRNMYSIDVDIKQLHLLQYLDMIHCELFHKNNCIVSTNFKHKFITICSDDQDEEKNDGMNNITDLEQYQFGFRLEYWDKYALCFIEAKSNNLKEEYLNNSLHPITVDTFDWLLRKSIDFKEIYKDNMMNAKREMVWMHGTVQMNEEMSIEHIMVIKSYCDLDEMQRKYKNAFIKYKSESSNTFLRRNCEIGIWCRLFQESVHCFGDVFKSDDCVYHGLSTKLRFDGVQTQFNVPTSCTRSLQVAERFATNDLKHGIVIELQSTSSAEILNYYFDVYSKYSFSSYSSEQENILYGASLGFKDIIYHDIYNKYSHSAFVASLSLYQDIIYGYWFSHNKNICTRQNQEIIIRFMECMIDEKNSINHEFDPYILYLFKSITIHVRFDQKLIYLNKEEFNKLSNEFRNVFLNEFLKFLKVKYGINMKYEHNVVCVKLSTGRNPIISSKNSYDPGTYVASYTHQFSDNIYDIIRFDFGYMKGHDKIGNTFNEVVSISSFPKNVDCIQISYHLWFPQISYHTSACVRFTDGRKFAGAKVFNLTLLSTIDPVDINVTVQCVDIQYKE